MKNIIRRDNLFIAISLAIIIFSAINIINNRNERKMHLKSRIRGNYLVEKILEYQIEHNKLPRSLKDLVPKYVDKIIYPHFKNSQYLYSINPNASEKDSFYLGYRGPKNMICQRTPDTRWECN